MVERLQKMGYETTSLIGEQATKRNIEAALQQLCSEGGNIFFHYSGHGSLQHSGQHDSQGQPPNVLVPADKDTAGYIDDKYLRSCIDYLPEGSVFLSTLDCCHSQTGFNLRFVYEQPRDVTIYPEYTPTKACVAILSSALDEQKSYETNFRGVKTGELTAAINTCWDENISDPLIILERIQGQIRTSRPCLSLGKNNGCVINFL
jgi:hypothetical protein